MILDWNIDYECEPIGCPDVNIYFDAYVSRPPSSHTVCDAVCYRNTLRSDSSGSTIASNIKPDPIFMINGGNVLERCALYLFSAHFPSALILYS